MTTTLETRDVLASRDAGAVAKVLPVLSAVMKGWHRSEVHGMGNVPPGGALLVSNHSGGVLAVDVPIIAVSFAEHFGTYRPLAVLAHDNLFTGPLGPLLRRMGFLPAKPENAAAALRAGAATIVFPGGDYDAYRPTFAANKIDFKGRTGYIRTALEAGVPIVPIVSIGGQETQLVLTRGTAVAKRLGLKKVLGSELLPLTVGFPFGLTPAMPPNLPLPSKITTRVLEPIDLADFGPEPDIAAIDAEVRRRMQVALDELAAARRFPVIG